MNPFSNSPITVKARYFAWAFLLQALPLASAGQLRLTLNEAINEGLTNHFGIRVARNEASMAAGNVTRGNAGMLPQVTAFGEADKASLNAEVHTALGTRIDKEAAAVDLFSAGLQTQWTLFDGSAMFLEYDRLKSQSSLAALTLQNELEEAIHDITAAYFDLVRQQRLLESSREKLEMSTMRRTIARERYRAGAGSELEMIQAEVTHLADTTALTQQETVVRKAGLKLNELLAADLERQVVPADSITLVELPHLAGIIEKALRVNTSRLYAGETHHLRELELNLAKARKLPRLTLKGTYLFTQNKTEASLINYTRTLGPQIGINASVPLFDGFNMNRTISQAEMSLENQTIRIAEMEQELTALILDTWYDHQNLLQLVTLGRQRCRLAEKNMTIASEGYTNGSVSSLQLREAQTDLFQAHANLTDALFQARVMESALLKLSGELVKSGQP